MMCSVALLPAVVCGTSFCINFIAMYYHASRAIPFGSMVGLSLKTSYSSYLTLCLVNLEEKFFACT